MPFGFCYEGLGIPKPAPYWQRALQRLAGAEADALCAELHCVRWVGYVFVVVVFMDNLLIFKACGPHGANELCIQQSAGNSTRPERDVFERILRHRVLHQNVAHLQPPAGLEHTEPLAQSLGFVEREVKHAVADDHISEAVGQG